MGERYIFNIAHLTKHYGKKEVLKDINLYFYPGAKIGVIGVERVRQVHAAARSWPARTRSSWARPGPRRARPSATSRRSRTSRPARPSWRTSRRRSRTSAAC